jgi:glyoxylase-like metal-dependent hydrolase (beta-lactamase superfamily II)
MQIHVINQGNFKLDGGAMFGVVPKTIWQKTNPADANNMCDWAMRSLLIENNNKLILIDTGIGNKQNEKFYSHYYLSETDLFEKNLNKLGYSKEDITDVFLTHLHFDHCGGAIQLNKEKTGYEPGFKNAIYWSNEEHWEWATNPNPREKASFLKENILPIQESGQLKFIKKENSNSIAKSVFDNIDVLFVDGHTESMMLPIIHYKDKSIYYMADLIPSTGHIPIPYVMGYDTRPLLTINEKEYVLNEVANKEHILFFEHDYKNECCTVQHTEKGIRLKETFKLTEII